MLTVYLPDNSGFYVSEKPLINAKISFEVWRREPLFRRTDIWMSIGFGGYTYPATPKAREIYEALDKLGVTETMNFGSVKTLPDLTISKLIKQTKYEGVFKNG